MSIKRRLRKLANTNNAIKQQYIQYPDLDEISFWIYLPTNSGASKKFTLVSSNPEKGLLLNKWYAHKNNSFNKTAIDVNDNVFIVYTCKDIGVSEVYAVVCEELKIYLILRGNGELQNFITTGKLYVINHFIETSKTRNSQVFTTQPQF